MNKKQIILKTTLYHKKASSELVPEHHTEAQPYHHFRGHKFKGKKSLTQCLKHGLFALQ